MKYEVVYHKQKKNKVTQQSAVFFSIEDAIRWENYIKEQGYTQSQILVK